MFQQLLSLIPAMAVAADEAAMEGASTGPGSRAGAVIRVLLLAALFILSITLLLLPAIERRRRLWKAEWRVIAGTVVAGAAGGLTGLAAGMILSFHTGGVQPLIVASAGGLGFAVTAWTYHFHMREPGRDRRLEGIRLILFSLGILAVAMAGVSLASRGAMEFHPYFGILKAEAVAGYWEQGTRYAVFLLVWCLLAAAFARAVERGVDRPRVLRWRKSVPPLLSQPAVETAAGPAVEEGIEPEFDPGAPAVEAAPEPMDNPAGPEEPGRSEPALPPEPSDVGEPDAPDGSEPR